TLIIKLHTYTKLFRTYKKKYKNLELDDFYICIDSKLYKYKDMVIKKNIIFSNLISDNIWKFNDKDGCIGIKCIDNSKCNSIEFIDRKSTRLNSSHDSI